MSNLDRLKSAQELIQIVIDDLIHEAAKANKERALEIKAKSDTLNTIVSKLEELMGGV